MENLKNFLQTATLIHPEAEEVCICNGKIEENFFDIKYAPKELVYELIHAIGIIFNEGIELDKLQAFSFQDADGISYKEPKLMLLYDQGEEFAKSLNLPIGKAHDQYCINFFLHSKTKQYKFYDLMIDQHKYPELPVGSYYAVPYGIGISADGLRKDAYFVNKNIKAVAAFYNLPLPTINELSVFDEDNEIEKIFGLTYDSETLKPLKLKRYHYPRDPYIKTTIYDEVWN